MEHAELAAWLRLTLTPGVGADTGRRLLAAFGLPMAVFDAPAAALRQVATPAQTAALQVHPTGLAALLDTTWAWLNERDATGARRRCLTLGDPDYPAGLLAMEDPPLMLYLLGASNFGPEVPAAGAPERIPAIDSVANAVAPGVAIVGTRNPTPQGARDAHAFAQHFAGAGMTVVSGLALGIDAAAHQGALDGAKAGICPTIAIVGTGLDRVYPRQNRALAHRIAQEGLLVSEYALGMPPLAANFPRRNRLIAGLSLGTLVVEAAQPSGSLITARMAVEQGKEVFAIPGSIHAPQSRGCHALIRQGAKLVETAQDVLEELPAFADRTRTAAPAVARRTPAPAPQPALFSSAATGPADAQPRDEDEDEEDGLLGAMGWNPVGLDALVARTGIDAAALQVRLLELELDDAVARLPGGLFQRLARG